MCVCPIPFLYLLSNSGRFLEGGKCMRITLLILRFPWQPLYDMLSVTVIMIINTFMPCGIIMLKGRGDIRGVIQVKKK